MPDAPKSNRREYGLDKKKIPNRFALDFVARQKVDGLHLRVFIVHQLLLLWHVEYTKNCP